MLSVVTLDETVVSVLARKCVLVRRTAHARRCACTRRLSTAMQLLNCRCRRSAVMRGLRMSRVARALCSARAQQLQRAPQSRRPWSSAMYACRSTGASAPASVWNWPHVRQLVPHCGDAPQILHGCRLYRITRPALSNRPIALRVGASRRAALPIAAKSSPASAEGKSLRTRAGTSRREPAARGTRPVTQALCSNLRAAARASLLTSTPPSMRASSSWRACGPSSSTALWVMPSTGALLTR